MRFVNLKLMFVVISVLVLCLAIPAVQAGVQIYAAWSPSIGGSSLSRANTGSTIAGSYSIRINLYTSAWIHEFSVTSASCSEANNCTPTP